MPYYIIDDWTINLILLIPSLDLLDPSRELTNQPGITKLQTCSY